MEIVQLSQDGSDPCKIVETIFKTDSKVKPLQNAIKKHKSDLLETMIAHNIKKIPIPGTKDFVERNKKQKKGKLDKKTVERIFIDVVGRKSKLLAPFSKKLDEVLKPSILDEEELKFPKKKAKKQPPQHGALNESNQSVLGKRKHNEMEDEDDCEKEDKKNDDDKNKMNDDDDDDDDGEKEKQVSAESGRSLSDDDGDDDIFESNKKKQKVSDVDASAVPRALNLDAEKVSAENGNVN